MNILQILPELNVGGVETGTIDLARYLVEHGHKSIVVSSGGALVGDLEKNGSKHYTLGVKKKNIFSMLRAVKKLVHIIKSEKIDIVHARSRVPAWIAFFACRQTQAVFITTCHGYYSKHLFSRVMGWGKLVIVISEVIGQHMVQDFGVSSHFVRIIARSVDMSKFNIPHKQKNSNDPYVVTMVGRITPLKGHAYFLKAMAQVVRNIPDLKVQIIGDASANRMGYKEELIVLTKRLGIAHVVDFMGNRRDIPQLLSHSDCLVLSTVTQEAFGRVILEAQAAGVPVVASKVGGVAEIIDHEKTGLLVPPKDVDAIAKEVIRVLKNPEFAQQMVKASQEKIADRYTLKHMAEATLQVYRESISSLNILVIKLTAVGDAILITASLKALRQRYPDAQIHVLTSVETRVIFQRCPYINSVIVMDVANKNFFSVVQISKTLRKYGFDKVIDLQNNRLSHLLSFLSFPKLSYGYRNGKFGFLLTHAIEDDLKDITPVEHQFRILKLLGIEYHDDVKLDLWPSVKDDQHISELLDSEWMGSYKDMVGLNVAASAKWSTKNWPVEHIARLCDLLAAKNIRVVLTGQNKDLTKARQILSKTKSKPVNLVGKTDILQLAALMKRLKVYISPDSAPLHIAAAMKTPVVAFFGPTDPQRHKPPADKIVILYKDLKCSPCYSGSCKIKTHACMIEITPEQVAKEVLGLMS